MKKSLKGALEGLLLGILLLPVLLSFFPVAFQLSWVNFTYGARGLDPDFKATLPKLFLYVAVAALIFEIIFRRVILCFFIRKFSLQKAFWRHLLLINIILSPLFWHYGGQMEQMGFLRFLLLENLLQAFWALSFLKTGSLIATAFLHGCYSFLRFLVINDAEGPFETLYFYSAASDDFYWLIVAVTLLGVSLLVLIIQRWGMRAMEVAK